MVEFAPERPVWIKQRFSDACVAEVYAAHAGYEKEVAMLNSRAIARIAYICYLVCHRLRRVSNGKHPG